MLKITFPNAFSSLQRRRSGRSEVRILLATGFRRAECISQLIDSALSFFTGEMREDEGPAKD